MPPAEAARARHRVRCTVHGLTIASDAPLHSAGTRDDDSTPPDVLVDWDGPRARRATGPPAGAAQVIVEPTGGWLAVSPAAGTTRLRFGLGTEHVEFAISGDGTRVSVSWTPGVLPGDASTLLLTTVVAYLHHLRGRLVLHAGVVEWRGAAFLLAGAQGAGKSTTVGALVQRGCAALADDMAVPVRQAEGWAIPPGPTGIRLADDARTSLGLPASAATPLWPRSAALAGVTGHREDRVVVALARMHDVGGPLPLAGIFLLGPRGTAAPRVDAIAAAAAVPRLAEHVRAPAWYATAVDERRFAELADLARCAPVFTVGRPDDLAALPLVCDALLGEMERARR